jgi:branched-chain amino acid transport system substrate-binding protein
MKAGAAGISLGLAGCTGGNDGGSGGDTTTQSGATPQGSDDQIKIGMAYSPTGPAAAAGQYHDKGIRLAINELNSQGGIDGRSVSLHQRRNELDAAKAAENARELVNEVGVDLMTGTTTGGTNTAILETIASEDLNVPFLTVSGTVSITGEDCQPFNARVTTNSHMVAHSAISYLIENLGIESNIYFVGLDYTWGRGAFESVKNVLQKKGYNPDDVIVGTGWPGFGTQDYSPIVTNLQAADPDAVIAFTTGGDASRFMNAMDQVGALDSTKLIGYGLGSVRSIKAVGKLNIGTYGAKRWSYTKDSPGSKEFVDKYLNRHGEVPHEWATDTYRSMMLYNSMVDEAGSADAGDIISEMSGFEWEDPIFGDLKIRECDHQTNVPVTVVKGVNASEYDGIYADQAINGVTPVIQREFDADKGNTRRSCDETGCDI